MARIYVWAKAKAKGPAYQAEADDLGFDLLVMGPAIAGVALVLEAPAARDGKRGVRVAGVAAAEEGDLVLWWASHPEAEARSFAARPRRPGTSPEEDAEAFASERLGDLQEHVERALDEAPRDRAAKRKAGQRRRR